MQMTTKAVADSHTTMAHDLTRAACDVSRFDAHFLQYECANTWATRIKLHNEIFGAMESKIKGALHCMQGRSLVFIGDSITQQHWLEALWLSSLVESSFVCPEYTSVAYNDFRFSSKKAHCAKTQDWARGIRGLRVCFVYAVPDLLSEARPDLLTDRFRWAMERLALSKRDFVVANMGLWHSSERLGDLRAAVSNFTRFVDDVTALPGVLWRETSPQHFPPAVHKHGLDQQGGSSTPFDTCLPAPPEAALTLNARNEVTNPIVLASRKVRLIRVWHASIRDWSGHLGATTNRQGRNVTDCTHYCLPSPTLLKWTLDVWRACSVPDATLD